MDEINTNAVEELKTLEVLTYDELIQAVGSAAKKKNKKLGKVQEPIQVNFRWGESFSGDTPYDGIFATIDVVVQGDANV